MLIHHSGVLLELLAETIVIVSGIGLLEWNCISGLFPVSIERFSLTSSENTIDGATESFRTGSTQPQNPGSYVMKYRFGIPCEVVVFELLNNTNRLKLRLDEASTNYGLRLRFLMIHS